MHASRRPAIGATQPLCVHHSQCVFIITTLFQQHPLPLQVAMCCLRMQPIVSLCVVSLCVSFGCRHAGTIYGPVSALANQTNGGGGRRARYLDRSFSNRTSGWHFWMLPVLSLCGCLPPNNVQLLQALLLYAGRSPHTNSLRLVETR